MEALQRLRQSGWTVAVHNDYKLNGRFHTFWLFTKGGLAIKGEGESDEQALTICEQESERLAPYRLTKFVKGVVRPLDLTTEI